MQFLLSAKANVGLAFVAFLTAFLVSYFEYEIPLPKLPQLNFRFSSGSGGSAAPKEFKGKAAAAVNGRLLSRPELAKYDGTKGSKGLYIALLGRVYDVEKGKQHYGPKGGYHGFAGKDGSRAFITGDFTAKGLVDDLGGLELQDYLGIEDWLSFYAKDYSHVGYVEGAFYDAKGRPTAKLRAVEAKIGEAHAWKAAEAQESQRYPPCNSEWSEKKGSRVWCSNKSGGVERDWVGVPRKMYKAGSTTARCACISAADLSHVGLKMYEGCPPDSASCTFKS